MLTIYTKNYCGWCHKLKVQLDAARIPYAEVDITHDAEANAKMAAKTGGDATVPQVFLGEEYVGDYDVIEKLIENGELAKRAANTK